MLKHLKRVRIEFNPFHAASRSALEFLSQCKARSAVDSNPSCELTVRRRTDQQPPFVQVTFVNGREETMSFAEMNAQTVRNSILKRAEQMETEQMFKDAGLAWPIVIPGEEVKAMEAEIAERHKKRLS